MKYKTKESIRLLLIVLSTIEFTLLSHITDGIIVFKSASEVINKHIIYQSVTLSLSFLFLFFYTYKKTIVAEIFQDEDNDEF